MNNIVPDDAIVTEIHAERNRQRGASGGGASCRRTRACIETALQSCSRNSAEIERERVLDGKRIIFFFFKDQCFIQQHLRQQLNHRASKGFGLDPWLGREVGV